MKKVIGYIPVITNGEVLQRAVWQHFDPILPEGNFIDIKDIPPLDADPRFWKEGLYGNKER